MKRLLLCMLAGLVAALAGIQIFDLFLEPNSSFFERAAKVSDAWDARLRAASSEPCYIIGGGSEIRMGVCPQRMLQEYGVRAVNAGGAAFFGLHVNTRMALEYARPGDTLVMALSSLRMPEKDLVTPGLKFAWRRLGPSMFDGRMIPLDSYTAGEIWRGSSSTLSMYICKRICTPDEMYKYDVRTRIHPSGWCELFYDDMARSKPWEPAVPHNLAPYGQVNQPMREYLAALQESCRQRQVHLAVYLPPGCAHESLRPISAMVALGFTRLGIPVIRTEPLGIEPDNMLFADMPAHLNTAGTVKHSRILAEALQQRRFWTEEELEGIIRRYGKVSR